MLRGSGGGVLADMMKVDAVICVGTIEDSGVKGDAFGAYRYCQVFAVSAVSRASAHSAPGFHG